MGRLRGPSRPLIWGFRLWLGGNLTWKTAKDWIPLESAFLTADAYVLPHIAVTIM